ncbi:hypothetical protein V1514DRAFT_328814 [Lipomyces japonicus]|uniref:uncharacterized protein n=1 Tax=Lipomyces japonicus TaxID=56871 RepID=UPI0034CF93A1
MPDQGGQYVSFQENTTPPQTPVAKRKPSLFAMTATNGDDAAERVHRSRTELEQDSPALHESNKHGRAKWHLGLFFIMIVVLFWVSSSFMVNSIFETDIYRKPYLVTYLTTATFSLYLIRPLLDGTFSLSRSSSQLKHLDSYGRDSLDESSFLASDSERSSVDHPDSSESSVTQSPILLQQEQEQLGLDKNQAGLSLSETAKLSFQFCLLWFIANWFANACLSYTSVASGTILSCTSSFFTLLIGSVIGVEFFTRRKLIALVVSLAGIILISTQDSVSQDQADNNLTAGSIVVGDAMALVSAAIYGLYTTLLKLRIGDESRINMQVFFGFVGVFNVILLWPILLLLHFTGAERLEAPPSSFVWLILLLNCSVTLVSDYLWIVAILLTSPLVVTVGLSGTIPLAVVGDVVFNHVHVTLWYVLGAFLVGGAFFVINRDEEHEHLESHVDDHDS